MIFEEAAKDFLDYIKVTKSDGTHRYQLGRVQSLRHYFSNKDIETINKKTIVKYIAYHKDKNPNVSNVTLNKNIATMNRIIEYNEYDGLNFEKLREPQTVKNALPRDVVDTVLNYLKDNMNTTKEYFRNYVLFKLLLDTGIRINEALNLRVQDIDFNERIILLRVTKSKRERYTFYTKPVGALLEKFILSHEINDYLFWNYHQNKRLTVDNVQKVCTRMKKRLNLNISITPHAWRHTFANEFIKNGGNLETLRLILGHTSLKTTQIYLHLDKEALQDEYRRIHGSN